VLENEEGRWEVGWKGEAIPGGVRIDEN
jgi:hypothetical protein